MKIDPATQFPSQLLKQRRLDLPSLPSLQQTKPQAEAEKMASIDVCWIFWDYLGMDIVEF